MELKPSDISRFKARFASLPRSESGCIEWNGATNQSGYGLFAVTRKPRCSQRSERAHRVAFTLYVGDIGNLLVCHRCDNRKCVNPEHLFLGTHKDNTMDALLKGRMAVGGTPHKTTLTADDVREIRGLRDAGIPPAWIAPAFRVSNSTVRHIHKRITWRHVA